jgi:ABC-type nitrate/sulfonate/bicarbonate transport system permease component
MRVGVNAGSSVVSARPRRAITASKGGQLALGGAGLLVLAVVWEVLPRAQIVDPTYFPPLSANLAELAGLLASSAFWIALGQTLGSWALGLTIASVAAVVIGMILGSIPVAREATASTIEFLRPIPSVALIPLVVLLYGTDLRSTLILVVYASFWQVLVQVLSGVTDVDPVARDTARSFRFRRSTIVGSVMWPTALPYLMTGLRLGAAVALIIEITGELIIGSPGLGKLISLAQSSGAVSMMYALVIVTGLIGVAVNGLARSAESRLLRWHTSIRGEEPR